MTGWVGSWRRLAVFVCTLALLIGLVPCGLAQEGPTSGAAPASTLPAQGTPIDHTIANGTHIVDAALLTNIANLTVNQGAVAVIDFATAGNLTLTGTLTNFGTIYAASSTDQQTTATISASSIFNNAGGLLTTVLPAGGMPGFASAGLPLNLNLTAVHDIINAGTIASAGSLSMTAGGSIVNQATISAMQSLNLTASQTVNQGTISAMTGNLNIALSNLVSSESFAQATQKLALINSGGVLEALQGSLAVRLLSSGTLSIVNQEGALRALTDVSFVNKALAGNSDARGIELAGGQVFAPDINFASPGNFIHVSADRLDGQVNLAGSAASVGAYNGDLAIASLDVTGDPIFHAAGNLDISGLFSSGSTFSTSGEDFIALAGGSITAATAPADAVIDASGSGSKVFIAAGALFTVTPDGAGPIACSDCSAHYDFIDPKSLTGGDVNLPNVALKNQGGGIDVYAFGQLPQSTSTPLGSGNVSVKGMDSSSANGTGGNVKVLADGVLTVETLNTSGGNGATPGSPGGNGGNVLVDTGGSITIGSVVTTGGQGSPGDAQIFLGSGGQGGNAGTVSIHSGGNITFQAPISASGGQGGQGAAGLTSSSFSDPGGTGGSGGQGGNAGAVTIHSGGSTTFQASINASGGQGGQGGQGGVSGFFPVGGGGGSGGQGGNAGAVTIRSGGTTTIQGSIFTAGGQGGQGGPGGTGHFFSGPAGTTGNTGSSGIISLLASMGNIALSGQIGFTGTPSASGGQANIQILAGGSVTHSGTGTFIDVGDTLVGPAITIGAGVSVDSSNYIIGASGSGGDISFAHVSLESSSSHITLTAYDKTPTFTGTQLGSGSITVLNIDASGQPGIGAGTISLYAAGNVSVGSLRADGMAGSGGVAGAQGFAGSSTGTPAQNGGTAGSAGGSGSGGSNAGAIVLNWTGSGTFAIGSISAVGGAGGSGGAGGAGGAAGTAGQGGAGQNGGNGGSGGQGGSITLKLNSSGAVSLGAMRIDGGNGGSGGVGGAGGAGGTGTSGAHDLPADPGGAGGAAGAGGAGGAGGSAGGISLTSHGSGSVSIESISASGGTGGAGATGGLGGKAGNGVDGWSAQHTFFDDPTAGGNGGAGGAGGSGGSGSNGGQGGTIVASLISSGTVTLGPLTMDGGAGGEGGDGGAGNAGGAAGKGGDGGVFTGGAAGGTGGTSGQGGNAGNGGTGGSAGTFKVTGPEAFLIFHVPGTSTSKSAFSAAGGQGGSGGSGGGSSTGGSGGAGTAGGFNPTGGGSGGSGGAPGASGNGGLAGDGGAAGSLELVANKLSVQTSIAALTFANLPGGNGGTGGPGGAGASGGDGGSGGAAIGRGASSGAAGAGATGGSAGGGGGGGSGGSVKISTRDSISIVGDIIADGGSGGSGAPGGSGGNGGTGGMGGESIFVGGSGSQGGAGGEGGGGGGGGGGGTAGSIHLTASLGDVSLSGVYAQGGPGGSGGNGGAGGNGGTGGSNGDGFKVSFGVNANFVAGANFTGTETDYLTIKADVEFTYSSVGLSGGEGGIGGAEGIPGAAGNGGNVSILAPAASVGVSGNIWSTGANAGNYGQFGIHGKNGKVGASHSYFAIGADASLKFTPKSLFEGPELGLGPTITVGNTTVGIEVEGPLATYFDGGEKNVKFVFSQKFSHENKAAFNATTRETGSFSSVFHANNIKVTNSGVTTSFSLLTAEWPPEHKEAPDAEHASSHIPEQYQNLQKAFFNVGTAHSQNTSFAQGYFDFPEHAGSNSNNGGSTNTLNVSVPEPASGGSSSAVEINPVGGANLSGTTPDLFKLSTAITPSQGGDITVIAKSHLTIQGTVNNVGGMSTSLYSRETSPVPEYKLVPNIGAGGSVLLEGNAITIVAAGARIPPGITNVASDAAPYALNVGSVTFITRPGGVPLLIKPVAFGGLTWTTSSGLNIADGQGLVLSSNRVYVIQNNNGDVALASHSQPRTNGQRQVTADFIVLASGSITADPQSSGQTQSFSNFVAEVFEAKIRAEGIYPQFDIVTPAQVIMAAGDKAATQDYSAGKTPWLVVGDPSSTGGTIYLPNFSVQAEQLVYLSAAAKVDTRAVDQALPTGHILVSTIPGLTVSSGAALHMISAGNTVVGKTVAPYTTLTSFGSITQETGPSVIPSVLVQSTWLQIQSLNVIGLTAQPYGNPTTPELFLTGGNAPVLEVAFAAGRMTVAGELTAAGINLSAQSFSIGGNLTATGKTSYVSLLSTGDIADSTFRNGAVISASNIHLQSTAGSLNLSNITASDPQGRVVMFARTSITANNVTAGFLAAFAGTGDISIAGARAPELVAGTLGNVNITSLVGVALGGTGLSQGGTKEFPSYGHDFSLTAPSITVTGQVNSSGRLDLIASDGGLVLNAPIASSTRVSIQANSIVQTAGTISGPDQIRLEVDADVGSANQPLFTSTRSIIFPNTDSNTGSAYIFNFNVTETAGAPPDNLTVALSGPSSSFAFNGGTFKLAATGNIIVQGDITALGETPQEVSLAAAGGHSISLYGSITGETVSLTSVGARILDSGSITQYSGVINTGTLNLSTGSGGAKSTSTDSSVQITNNGFSPFGNPTTTINVLSGGSVYLTSSEGITLGAINMEHPGSVFHAQAENDIHSKGTVTAAYIELLSNTGFIGPTTPVLVASPTKGSPVQLSLSAPAASGGFQVVSKTDALSLMRAIAGGATSDVQIESKGDLLVSSSAPVSATVVYLISDSGSIILNAPITTTPSGIGGNELVVIQAYKNITGTGQLTRIQGGSVLLTTSTGSIGQASTPLAVDSDNMEVQVSGTGSAFITSTQDVTLSGANLSPFNSRNESFVGGMFSLKSTGMITLAERIAAGSVTIDAGTGLTVSNVTAHAGSVLLLSGSGTVDVSNNATILAHGGVLTIQNLDSQNGLISIGAGASLTAHQTNSTVGQITLVVGALPTSKVAGTAPSPALVQLVGVDGNVYWGSGGVAASSPQNTINLQGGDVMFSAASSSGISLGGAVTISSRSDVPSGFLRSLDLTDTDVVNAVVSLQQIGHIGGKLVPTFAGTTLTALSGTVVINPYNVTTDGLGALNVSTPSSAVDSLELRFVGFSEEAPVNVHLTAASTTGTVLVGDNSTLSFAASAPTILAVSIQTTVAGPALTIADSGQLVAGGNITLSVAGSSTVDGTITSFGNLKFQTDGLQRSAGTGAGQLAIEGGTLSIKSTGTVGSSGMPYNLSVANAHTSSLALVVDGDAYIASATTLPLADTNVSGLLSLSAAASSGQIAAISTVPEATVVADQLSLTASSGNIGASSTDRLIIDVNTLTVTAALGSIHIHERGDLTIAGANSATNASAGNPAAARFDLLANGQISSSGASPSITASNVVLRSTAEGIDYHGAINVTLASPGIQTSLELRAVKSISHSSIGLISGTLMPTPTSLSLTSDEGNIGSADARFDLSTANIGSGTFNAPAGSIYLNVADLTLAASSVAGETFDISATGLTVNGTVSAKDIKAIAQDIAFGANGSLVASADVDITVESMSGAQISAGQEVSIANTNAAAPAVFQLKKVQSSSTALEHSIRISSASALRFIGSNSIAADSGSGVKLSSPVALMLGSSTDGVQLDVTGNVLILAPAIQGHAGVSTKLAVIGSISAGSASSALSMAPQSGSVGAVMLEVKSTNVRLIGSSITVPAPVTVTGDGALSIETSTLTNSGVISSHSIDISLLSGGTLTNSGRIVADSTLAIGNSATTSTFTLTLGAGSELTANEIFLTSSNGAPLEVVGTPILTASTVTFDAGFSQLTVNLGTLAPAIKATGSNISITTASGDLHFRPGIVARSQTSTLPGISINAAGKVTVDSMSAGNGIITISGSSLARSGGTVSADTVVLTSTSGEIGTQEEPFSVSAKHLELTTAAGQDTYLTSPGNLVLDDVTVSGNLTVTAASLSVLVSLTLGQISLGSTLGDLAVNSALTGNSVTITSASDVHGTGSIEAGSTYISAAGDVGSAGKRFQLATQDVVGAHLVTNSSSGSVFIAADSDLVIAGRSAAAREFNLQVEGNFSQSNSSSTISAADLRISSSGNSVLSAALTASNSLTLEAQNLTVPSGVDVTSAGPISISIGDPNGILDGTLAVSGALSAGGRQLINHLNIRGLGTLGMAGTAQLNPSSGGIVTIEAPEGIAFASGTTLTVPAGDLVLSTPQVEGPLATVTVSEGNLFLQAAGKLAIGSSTGGPGNPTSLALNARQVQLTSDQLIVHPFATLSSSGSIYASQQQATIDGTIDTHDQFEMVVLNGTLSLNGSIFSTIGDVHIAVVGPSARIAGSLDASAGTVLVVGRSADTFDVVVDGSISSGLDSGFSNRGAGGSLKVTLNSDISAGRTLQFASDGEIVVSGTANMLSDHVIAASNSASTSVSVTGSIAGDITVKGTAIEVTSTAGDLAFLGDVSTSGTQAGLIAVSAAGGQISANSFSAPGGTVRLTASGDITKAGVGLLSAARVLATSSAGSVGSQANPLEIKGKTASGETSIVDLQVNASSSGQNVFVRGLSDINLVEGVSSAGAGGTFSLSAGSLTSDSAARAQGATVVLEATRQNTGSSSSPFSIDAEELNAISPMGSTYVSDLAGGVNINGGASDVRDTFQIHSAGSITASNGAVVAGAVELFASGGASIGSPSSAFAMTTSRLVVSTTGNGSAYLHNLNAGLLELESGYVGGTLLLDTAGQLQTTGRIEAGSIGIESGMGMTVATMTANNGTLNLLAGSGTLAVLANSTLLANEGNLNVQNSNGTIVIGSNARLTGRSTAGALGRVNISVGTAAPAQIPGAPQALVTVQELNLGLVFLGAVGVSAASPANTVTADGGQVIFDTNGGPASTIVLAGGVRIVSKSSQPPVPVITSLDLSDPLAVAVLTDLQIEGHLGGKLQLTAGSATGGDIIISPARLAAAPITALNVPSGVEVTMAGFDTANALNVDITNTSTSSSYIVSGQQKFTGAARQASQVVVTTNQAAPAFIVNGSVSASGRLAITSADGARINGSLSAGSLSLSATTGDISLGSSSTVSAAQVNLTSTAGSIESDGGTVVTSSALSLSSGTDIGSTGHPLAINSGKLSLLATGDAFLDSLSSVQLVSAQSGNQFTLTSAGQISAVTGVTVTAPAISLSATSGNIGQSAQERLQVATDTLTLRAISGSVYVSESNAVTLAGASTAGGEFYLSTGTDLHVVGSVSASMVDFAVQGSRFTNSGQVTANGSSGGITVHSQGSSLELAGTGLLSPGSGQRVLYRALSGILLADGLDQTVLNGNYQLATSSLMGEGGGVAAITAATGSASINTPGGSLSVASTGGSTQMNLNATELSITGRQVSIAATNTLSTNGKATITATELTNDGQITSAGTMRLLLNSGGIATVNGTISSSGAHLSVESSGSGAGQSFKVNLGAGAALSATSVGANISLSAPHSGAPDGGSISVGGQGALNADNKIILNVGTNTITVDLGSLSGTLNIAAGKASVKAASSDLVLGPSHLLTFTPGTETSPTALKLVAQTGSITLADVVSSPAGPIEIQAATGIVGTNAGVLAAPLVTLRSTAGDIGSQANPITVAGVSMTANTSSTSGSVYVVSDQVVTVSGASSAGSGGSFNLKAGYLIIAAPGSIAANTINLTSDIGSVAAFGPVSGTGASSSITVSAQESISARSTIDAFSAASVSLTATDGSIAADSLANHLRVDTGSLVVNAPDGSVRVRRATAGTLTILAPSAAGDTLDIMAEGTVASQVGATLSAQIVRLQSVSAGLNLLADVSGSASVELHTSSSITNAMVTSLNNGNAVPRLTLTSANGDIGASAGSSFTANARSADISAHQGSVYFRSTNASGLTVLTAVARNVVDITSAHGVDIGLGSTVRASDVTISSAAGAFTTAARVVAQNDILINVADDISSSHAGILISREGVVTLASTTGSIGLSSQPLKINASTLVANAAAASQDIFVGAQGSVTLGSGTSSAGRTFHVSSSGSLIVSGGITAQNVTLVAADELTIAASLVVPQTVNLQAGEDIDATHLAQVNTGVTSDEFILASSRGDIGSAKQRLVVTTDKLAAIAPRGSVYIQDNDSIIVSHDSGAAHVFALAATGQISSTPDSTISAGTIVLRSIGAGFSLSGAVDASDSLSVQASSSLLNSHFAHIANTSRLIDLTSDNGNVGTSTDLFTVSTGEVVVSSPNGSIFLANTMGKAVVSSNLGTGGSLVVSSLGDVSIRDQIDSLLTSLTSTSGNVFVHDLLGATQSIDISAGNGSISSKDLVADGPAIGIAGGLVSLSARGAIFTGTISARGNTTAHGGTVEISSHGVVATGPISVAGSGAGFSAGSIAVLVDQINALPNQSIVVYSSPAGAISTYAVRNLSVVHFPAAGGASDSGTLIVGNADSAAGNAHLGALSANGASGAAGGVISINTPVGGTIVFGAVTADGSGAAPGGTITTSGQTLRVAGADSQGMSLSASGANGGSISLTTHSFETFVVGDGTSDSGTTGNVAANGVVNGGRIEVRNLFGQFIKDGTMVLANGGTGNGGEISFSTTMPGSAIEWLIVDGLVQAKNAADNSGRIGVNTGMPNFAVSVTGRGTLHGGEFVSIGNLVPGTLALSPLPGGYIHIGPKLTIRNMLLSNPGYLRSQQAPPSGVSYLALIAGLILAEQATIQAGTPRAGLVPTDVLPSLQSQSSAAAALPQFQLGTSVAGGSNLPPAQMIGGAKLLDQATVAELAKQGIQLGPGSQGAFLNLLKGALLISPAQGMTVHTREGSVHISAGTIAYVIETGDDSAVLNMHDGKSGSVRVTAGKQVFDVRPGQMAVLTPKANSTFAAVNPIGDIPTRQVTRYNAGGTVTAFIADFSIVSAMRSLGVLPALAQANAGGDRRAMDRLLKMAAIQAYMTSARGPFKTTSP